MNLHGVLTTGRMGDCYTTRDAIELNCFFAGGVGMLHGWQCSGPTLALCSEISLRDYIQSQTCLQSLESIGLWHADILTGCGL